MIDQYIFGKITVNRKEYGDIKIIGQKIVPWHFIENHTVTEQDVIEIFEDNPDYIVIGIGSNGMVHVDKEVIELAKKKNVKLIIESTKKACEEFNNLRKDVKKVDAIIHSTC